MANNTCQYLLISISIFLFSSFLFPLSSFSASPQFLTSWQAQSYTPLWYQGKVFPTRGSVMEINFELINNNKIVNLSKNIVRWYINDKLVKNEKNGLGIKSLKFINNNPPGSEIEVKIVVLDYGAEPLYKIVRIPVSQPEAVIDAPFAERKINKGKNLFRAYPFFFNVKDLNTLFFQWQANEQTAEPGANPRELNLDVDQQTPTGIKINIKTLIQNISDQFESASKNITAEVR